MKVISNEYVRPEMTDYEKVSAAFDWLCTNVKYDYETRDAYNGDKNAVSNPKSFGAEGALLNQLAVCSGYASAFNYIMKYYGISSCSVSSWELDHEWNAVQIDKKWYYIDATWEDFLFNDNNSKHYGHSFRYETSDPRKVNKSSRTESENSKKKGEMFKINPYLNTTRVVLAKGDDSFAIKLEGAKVKSLSWRGFS
jgi:transglutaminase/protease-like cytokinesis protein 3